MKAVERCKDCLCLIPPDRRGCPACYKRRKRREDKESKWKKSLDAKD